MKKSIFILLAVVLGITACNDSETSKCATCDIKNADESNILYQNSKLETSFDLYYLEKDGKLKTDYHLALNFSKNEEATIPIFMEELGIQVETLSRFDKAHNLVLFYNDNLNELEDKIDAKPIKAFLIYYILDKKMHVQGFKKNLQSNQFNEIADVKGYVTDVTTNDYISFARYIGLNNEGLYSVISLFNKVERSEHKHKTFLKDRLTSSLKNKAPDVGDGSDPGCTYPCFDVPMAVCMSNYDNTFGCYDSGGGPGECPKDETVETLLAAGETVTYDDGVLYQMRHYLTQSTLGQSYIDDYYYMGTIIQSEGISISLALDAVDLGLNVLNPIFISFLTDINSTSPLYTSSQATQIVDFLQQLKPVSTDIQFNNIIDDIDNMVTANKEVSSLAISQLF